MIYWDILLIAVIMVLIVDVSGFIGEMEGLLTKVLGFKCKIPKPFSCSLCMTWWAGLIYLIIINNMSLMTIAYTLAVACMTDIIEGMIRLIKDIITVIITKIDNLIF